jgi:hypothetical protein
MALDPKILESLKDAKVADLRAAFPAAFDAVVKEAVDTALAEAKATADAEKAKLEEAAKAGSTEVAKLNEKLDAQAKALAEADGRVKALEAASAEGARRAAVLQAIDEACTGKPKGEHKRAYLREEVLDGNLGADAVAKFVEKYDRLIAPGVPDVTVNERARTDAGAAKNEAAKPNGTSHAMGIAVPLSVAPTKGDAR